MDAKIVLSDFLTDEEIKALPDQRGLRSWAFEPYLELQPQATHSLDPLLHDLRDSWMQGFERKPNASRQANFLGCLRVILINLMRVQTFDDGLTVGMASGKGRLDHERRYRPAQATVSYHLQALALLQERGLVKIVQGGYHFFGYSQTARYALTDTALLTLPLEGLTVSDFSIARRDETIRLKNSEGQLIKYMDTEETHEMRLRLHKLNTLLESTDIGSTSHPNALTDFDEEFSGERTDLYRVFNNGSFSEGGRFYGGWWLHAKKHLRQTITINGQPTVEADFKGLHPAILFAKQGLSIPLDPYALVPKVDGNDTLRKHAKFTFLALLNASWKGTAEPRHFDTRAHGMTAEAFRHSVKAAFPMLPGIFDKGIGLKLQREDSDLAERVMMHFVDRGIPVLPVHDSFIIAANHHALLVSVMKTIFYEVYGQLPTVTVSPEV